MLAIDADDRHVALLQATARETRRLIVGAIHRAQAGHLGGPLSAADLLVALYFDVLRIDPKRPDWPDRDRFILSKGHASIGLYAVLAQRGYFPVAELDSFDEIDSRLQGHPDMTKLPGLEMSTGSLGQGLSPGIGMAIGARRRGLDFRTYVLLGDGELQEGQIWRPLSWPPAMGWITWWRSSTTTVCRSTHGRTRVARGSHSTSRRSPPAGRPSAGGCWRWMATIWPRWWQPSAMPTKVRALDQPR